MFAMGKIKPLSIRNGTMKKRVVIMACCWVDEIVEMKSPTPSVLKRKRDAAVKRRGKLPFKGMENQYTANIITMTIWAWAMIMYGMVFPMIISAGFKGVTISCSMVPASLSLMMAIDVKSSEISMTKKATMPGMKKFLLSRLGLYQVLIRVSILP